MSLMTAQQNPLQRSAPEALGISSSAILNFVEEAEKTIDALHSFMLLQHGQVVAEGWWAPYAAELPHMLFSLSKSFVSSAVGLTVEEGRLSVDDPVLSFFPEDAPASVSENLAAMCVRHLLTMATGHAEDTTGHLREDPDGNWAKAFLAQAVAYAPGTHFLYNSGATYILSAIVQKLAGMTVLDYLQPRLFEPLGIENATWESCPRGINVGGWGLSITTEDIANFGQLYLQNGEWQGKRILPADWVQAASASQISNGNNEESDWEQGYGYQFWRCRHGAYRGDGAFGQFCVVMPEQDAVLAVTSGVEDMQSVLNLVWAHLLPALGTTIPAADRDVQEKLARKLAGLSLRPQQGTQTSALAAGISGKTYAFAGNENKVETVSLDFGEEGCTITICDGRGEHQVRCGSGAWLKGTTTLDAVEVRRVAASGAWTAEDTYVMKLCLVETPFCPTITCRFVKDKLVYDFAANVSFGPKARPQIEGRMV